MHRARYTLTVESNLYICHIIGTVSKKGAARYGGFVRNGQQKMRGGGASLLCLI